MSEPRKDARDRLVRCWEKSVLLYQRFKAEPSWQLAWDLTKLVLYLMYQLAKRYMIFH